jgi:hypothetical protein
VCTRAPARRPAPVLRCGAVRGVGFGLAAGDGRAARARLARARRGGATYRFRTVQGLLSLAGEGTARSRTDRRGMHSQVQLVAPAQLAEQKYHLSGREKLKQERCTRTRTLTSHARTRAHTAHAHTRAHTRHTHAPARAHTSHARTRTHTHVTRTHARAHTRHTHARSRASAHTRIAAALAGGGPGPMWRAGARTAT